MAAPNTPMLVTPTGRAPLGAAVLVPEAEVEVRVPEALDARDADALVAAEEEPAALEEAAAEEEPAALEEAAADVAEAPEATAPEEAAVPAIWALTV
jgi:hypothetical protein